METAGYIASVLIGLSLGLMGGGGSILTVPVLIYFFSIDPVLSTTYSLFVVGATSMVGAILHFQKGNVDYKIASLYGIPSLIAVFIMRRWVVPMIPHHLFYFGKFELTKGDLLMIVFAILMLAASVAMIRKPQKTTKNRELNHKELIMQSLMVGAVTGFVGVGGGFLIIPSLVLLVGLTMKKAVGTSLAIMAISSLFGILGDASGNNVIDYTFLFSFIGFAVAGIIAGNYLTKFLVTAV